VIEKKLAGSQDSALHVELTRAPLNRIALLARTMLALVLLSLCRASLGQEAGSHPQAGTTGSETIGSARFTVITPQLIRMEYAPDHKFVDGESWFARNRAVHLATYQSHQNGRTLTIDTGTIHLVFVNDGKSFNGKNLQAEIKTPNGTILWKPETPQTGNLGGAHHALDRTQAAVPLEPGLISRDGWYLLDDSTSVIAAGDWYEARPNTQNVDWYFFGYGLDYKAALKSLTTIGGEVPLPRKSVMGAWYSRNWPYKEDEFKQIVNEYHQNDFPLDNIVMDYGWHIKGWTGYTWNKERIPDPTGLLQWFHQQGLEVTLNDHPDNSVQPEESMYADFMKAMGKNPSSHEIIPFDASDKHYLDTFYQYTHLPLMQQGVDFWWLDFGKPKVIKIPELDGLALLNQYNFKVTGEDGKRGQSFSRWAGWGDHRNPIHFSGDADSGWKMLEFEVPFTSTSGNSGLFFWSHDTGGYRGGRNEESYTRWTQFSALSATLRSHAAGNPSMDRRPWKWPSWATDSMRRSFHLRATLIPYVYTSAEQAVRDSIPFVRPVYIDHPTEEAAYHNGQEYYFGDNMLVAPIVAPGAGLNRVGWQHVWFPDGTWYQYFTGEKYTGQSNVLVAADINEFPLFVRAGVPLPEQPYNERPTSAPLDNLVLRCFPGSDGKPGVSQLYEDDGISNDYKSGSFATTELSYSRHGDKITVRIAPAKGTFHGQLPSRAYTILLPDTQHGTLTAPASAKLSYDASTGTNRIDVPTSPIGQGIVVELKAADLDPAQVRMKAETHRLDGLLSKPYAKWTDADRTALPPSVSDAEEAIHGIGLMSINQSPYLYGNDSKLVSFDPTSSSPVNATLSYKSWSEPITVANGQAIVFNAAQVIPPQDTIQVPGVENHLLLKVNGRNTPVSVQTSEMYNLQDLALTAKPSTSKGRGESAINGLADGAPEHPDDEWSAPAGPSHAWIKLVWPAPIKAKRILLYDLPNLGDWILGGTLTFSDGSTLAVGALPNEGKTPADIPFPEKQITWVRFDITKTSPSTKKEGLAEMGVFDR
jgi:alpha-glucosidase (family GH31 glycosyl hydrolase)